LNNKKTTFALFFGNRGFFPASLIAQAREELPRLLKSWGHDVMMMDEEATRYGAVETREEGERFANFLRENHGHFGGVIVSLPNFGDEFGAAIALKDVDVPILIQAYPDELDKMEPALRRDAFCGKLSIMDVFQQYDLKFTTLKPHVVYPDSEAFKENVDYFDRVCRVVNGMRGMVVGAIGARTTAFKTVRIDEITLQHHGIVVETIDLAEVIARVKAAPTNSETYRAKAAMFREYAAWDGVPDEAFENIIKLGLVLDELIEAYRMDTIALRCWLELQSQLGISPCVLVGELNNRLVSSACEVDIGSSVTMHALALASGQPATCLDWNNNYGDAENKCILFHCGPVPKALMKDKGQITDHLILQNELGEGRSYGCHVGRMAEMEFTFGNIMTNQGQVDIYLGQGQITADPVPDNFFGCAGVAQVDQLEEVLLHIGRTGHRHHVNLTPGRLQAPIQEALGHYLGFNVAIPQQNNSHP
jgi:L-fucose isomerase-like protein